MLRLASARTRVLARFDLAPRDAGLNRAGTLDAAAGHRVNVRFERVMFSLRRLLVLPLGALVRKVATPKGPAEKAGVTPCIDITYLDETLRVSRGGDGSLFVLERCIGDGGRRRDRPSPMLTDVEIAALTVTSKRTYNAATDLLPAGEPDAGAAPKESKP